jgi:hypothetical protein
VRTDVSEERVTSFIKVLLRGVLQMLVTANATLTSLIHFTMMMEATISSETSVLTRDPLHHIPEDGILRVKLF